VRFFRYSFTP